MNSLLIITGAGASYDCVQSSRANIKSEFTPPLAKNLFNTVPQKDNPTNETIALHLSNNPLAYQVGYKFHSSFAGNKLEQNLEQHLLEYKNSKKYIIKNQYWSVPIYLYELFWDISRKYLPTQHGLPSNYKVLIDEISKSKYNQIIWLNLNYDLLADYAIKISVITQFSNLNDYIQLETKDDLKIKYTKPHGSVNWWRKILIPGGLRFDMIKEGLIPEDFEEQLTQEIYTQLTSGDDNKRYPAISAPIGKYDFVYPKHIEAIIPDLKSITDVLCIGFSALDRDILNLIKEHVPQIIKLKIVNGSHVAGKEAYEQIVKFCMEPETIVDHAAYEGGFSKFIEGELHRWLYL